MRDLERYQADYEALPFEAVQARYRRRKVLEILERVRPRHLLEAGCGLVPLFLDYTDFDSFHVVEPGRRFLANAAALAAGRAGVVLHAGTLEETAPALRGERFQFLVLSSVLHEVADPDALLEAARSLCAPETIVHVNVPNAHSMHRLLALEMGLISGAHELSPTQARMQQHTTYDSSSLGASLVRAGFEVVESGSFFIKPFTHAQMAAMLERGLIDDRILDGLYALGARLPEMGSEIYVNARLTH